MSNTRLLLSCVNTRVSLIGFDLERRVPFWYCPANVLRACGACYGADQTLWVASDSRVTRIAPDGLSTVALPGPYQNFVHSIKELDSGLLMMADTGNSRLLFFDGKTFPLALSPINEWGDSMPLDAIHLNDALPWEDGFLVSAFSHPPFARLKQEKMPWARWGLGTIFHLSRADHTTIARIAASGICCPHSVSSHGGNLFCCSSASGDFLRFVPDRPYGFRRDLCVHVTDTHFLRGVLRLEDAWVLGGSSTRHKRDGGSMELYLLHDNGSVETLVLNIVGEIYDILPWDSRMSALSETLLRTPCLTPGDGISEEVLSGDFPQRCEIPAEYR